MEERTIINDGVKMLAIDPNDAIVRDFAEGSEAKFISSYKELRNYSTDIPVIFRSMSQRKTVAECEKHRRDYYYIDTGYLGNTFKRKDWHRIVPNGMQHCAPKKMPADRFKTIVGNNDYLRFRSWRKHGKSILLVTPSDKPCKFYGINRTEWLEQTQATIKKYTDRPVVIRDKALRRDRIGKGSIFNQLVEDDVFAVVTYNSIAAIEAIGFGVPAFTMAPTAADNFCSKDLSLIETPQYAEPNEIIHWQNWLGYCQYTPREMQDGTALRIIKENEIL